MRETVYLVGSDPSLAQTAAAAVAQVPPIQLKLVSSVCELDAALEELAVVLVLVESQADADQTAAWLRRAMALKKPIPTILICDHQKGDLALPLLRLGAVDCLNRPLDLSRLVYLLDSLTLRTRMAVGRAEAAAPACAVQFLGEDKSFLFLPSTPNGAIINQIFRVAPLETSILLQGETGTGKTCLARLIHELSPRREQPFLVVNCGALSGSVIESEMFGHVKGAFTGADRDRVGKFAAAGSGTIFLDDMNALPLELQSKLLRVVEDRVFEPLGSNRPMLLKARLVVASNVALNEEVAAGRFRADLYYRLCVVAFFQPPLRENPAMVPAMATKFLGDFGGKLARPANRIDPAAMDALQKYTWPGNIRELRNIIERAVALSTGAVIQLEDLPPHIQHVNVLENKSPMKPETAAKSARVENVPIASAGPLAHVKHTAEAVHIADALARNNNNRMRAATELGISRMTLYNKMHLYGLIRAMPT